MFSDNSLNTKSFQTVAFRAIVESIIWGSDLKFEVKGKVL
ncbi:hypothetical protein DSTSK_22160 [Desulforhabdus sp. TSK]|nr:hypothetical protein DSTSK_22160 [Desulforhabdus sp. TSK]